MFSNFSTNYANEQKDLKEKIEVLNKNISTTEQKGNAITSFVDKVKKYTEIKELTPEIINELIDKILIHQQTRVDGKKYQQIDIYYSGVGIISVSANEYDFEKEFQNMLKNQIKRALGTFLIRIVLIKMLLNVLFFLISNSIIDFLFSLIINFTFCNAYWFLRFL